MDRKYYYPAHITSTPAGKEVAFVTNHNANQVYLLPEIQVQKFKALSGCRSLDGLLAQLKSVDTYKLSENVLQVQIQEWIKMGLLRPEALLKEKARSKNTQHPPLMSSTITCNRPDTLQKWLTPRINSPDYRNNKVPILISDDSEEKGMQQKNRLVVDKQRKNYPGTIIYNDRYYREKLIHELAGTVPEDVVRFALKGAEGLTSKRNIGTFGANRNAALLSTAGAYYYSSDDDLYYRFYQNKNQTSESTSSKIVFEDALLPAFRCFPDMESLEQASSSAPKFSLIDKAQQLFHEGVYSMLSDADLSCITPSIAHKLETGNAELRAVTAGYYGGRWYDSPITFLMHIDETETQFLNDPDAYQKMKYNGINICGFEDTTVTSSSFLQGGTMILDNTKLLPPCFPMGRHEDTAFGILLHRCFEHAFFLHLPVAAYHDPSNKIPFSEKAFSDASLGMGKMIELLLYRYTATFLSSSPVERMGEVGKQFQDIGEISLADFEGQLRAVQQHYVSVAVRHLEVLLKHFNGKPSWWAEDVQRYLEAQEEESKNPVAAVPRELRTKVNEPKNDKEAALTLFQSWLGQYGRLLEYWPELWETARRMNSLP